MMFMDSRSMSARSSVDGRSEMELTNKTRAPYISLLRSCERISSPHSINILSLRDGATLTMVSRACMRSILLTLTLCSCGLSSVAQSTSASSQPSPSPEPKTETRDPIERSDDSQAPSTFSVSFTNGARLHDLNLTHPSGPQPARSAGLADPHGTRLLHSG